MEEHRPVSDRESRVPVSIIIPTKNGGRFLREVLDGIFSQREGLEVIVVDSGSTDNTFAILKEYPVALVTVPPGEFNHGGTRNLGASRAAPGSKYLVFMTQDATPMPGWLEALIRPMEEDPLVAGVFSRQVPREGCNPVLKRYMLHEWQQCGGMARIIKSLNGPDDYAARRKWYTAFSNTSSCVRAGVFKEIPFRNAEFGEDRLWAGDVLEAGYKIAYEPDSAVIHSHNYSLMEQLRQNFDDADAPHADIKATSDLSRSFKLPRKILKDLIFIWKEPLYFSSRLGWSLYLPFWHLATLTGALLGRRKGRLPRRARQFLSRQYRIKAA